MGAMNREGQKWAKKGKKQVGLPNPQAKETAFTSMVRDWTNMWHEDGQFAKHSFRVCPNTTRKELAVGRNTRQTFTWTEYNLVMVKDLTPVHAWHDTRTCCCRFMGSDDHAKHP